MTSAVLSSMRMFSMCLSPSPRMYPTIEEVATLKINYISKLSQSFIFSIHKKLTS